MLIPCSKDKERILIFSKSSVTAKIVNLNLLDLDIQRNNILNKFSKSNSYIKFFNNPQLCCFFVSNLTSPDDDEDTSEDNEIKSILPKEYHSFKRFSK